MTLTRPGAVRRSAQRGHELRESLRLQALLLALRDRVQRIGTCSYTQSPASRSRSAANPGNFVKPMILAATAALLLAGIVARSVAEPTAPAAAANESWTPAQLDQLTAPIALYSDPLLGSILAASTYPLEVVQAARWLQDPANAALTGDALEAALEAQPWDPSVKSLVPIPAVLRLMDSNIDWTEQLGDAFLAQQGDVMDSVQRLRQRAAAQGALRSTPQQTVAADQNAITIEPVSPDVIYVPYYVPAVYGPWPWPAYPPYEFAAPPDVFIGGALIGFGIGIGIFEPLWGGYGWNWPGHGLVIYPPYPRPRHPGEPPRPNPNPVRPLPQPWRHDPQHRGGVPYRDAATTARYQIPGASGQRAFRGYPAQATPGPPMQAAPVHFPPPSPVSAARETTHVPTPPPPNPRPSYEPRPTSAPRAAPPAFESFGHGPQVRSEAERGFSSRSAAPPPSPPPAGGGGSHPHR